MSAPAVSVVIPTHDRSASLRRTLDALRAQTVPAGTFEVVVVADGCTDDTLRLLAAFDAPFPLRAIERPGAGAAAARNTGAAAASGRLLLFLDDDVEPAPGLVAAHVRAHDGGDDRVVVGPYPMAEAPRSDLFTIAKRSWWAGLFDAMGQAGHRFTYRDLVSGNLSLHRDLLRRLGGFDERIGSAGGEDWELGVRVLASDARLVFAPDALAVHHDQASRTASFRRMRLEGRADVLIGERHPALRPVLPLAAYDTFGVPLRRLLRMLAFRAPGLGDAAARALALLLTPAERLGARAAWRVLDRAIRRYWYWRGAAEQLGSERALTDFLSDPRSAAGSGEEITLDLREGLDAVERRLDAERPAAMRLRYGAIEIGHLPPQPGAERLRGAHLRPLLATTFAGPLLGALALEQLSPAPTEVGTDHRARAAMAEGAYVH